MTGEGSKPLRDVMNITHHGRSLAVERVLTDFGSEESFEHAAKRFEGHYRFHIGSSPAGRATNKSPKQPESYINDKLAEADIENDDDGQYADKMLIELDGCEIRTAVWKRTKIPRRKPPFTALPKG